MASGRLRRRARYETPQAKHAVTGSSHNGCSTPSPMKAIAAWRDAEEAWKRAGDGPGQIQAVGWQAVLAMRDDEPTGARLVRRTIVLAESETNRPRMTATALCEIGDALSGRSLLDHAQQIFETALSISEKTGSGLLEVASSLSGLGGVAQSRGKLEDARQYYERARALREKVAPDSLPLASSLNNLGNLAAREGNLPVAKDFYERALKIHESIAPRTLFVSGLLNNLGLVATYQGDLQAARDYHLRSLALREALAPNSLDQAASLTNLGNVAYHEGDLATARDYYRRALERYAKMAPGSMPLATNLSNLGVVAWTQGDLSVARDYLTQSLLVRQKLAPDSLDVAESLHALGNVALSLGDLSGARNYMERSLAIAEKQAPGSLNVAELLNSFGAIAFAQQDWKAARDYYLRALATREKLAANSLAVAMSLKNLGDIALENQDLSAASDYYQRSFDITEKLAPNSLNTAAALGTVGDLERARGNPAAAIAHHERALQIRQRLAPNSLDVADSLHQLSRISFDKADIASAADYSARAWAIVRTQATDVTGEEARQSFEMYFHPIGTHLVRSQIALGKTEAAFLTLEEGRAQTLLHMLSQRGVARRLAPADTWTRYEIAQTASDRAGSALEEAGSDPQKAEPARQAYTRLRLETEQRWAEVVRSIEPAVPTPLSPIDAKRALPGDTALAAFAVGEDASTLFIVQSDQPVRAYPIDLSLKELTQQVKLVRESASRIRIIRGVDRDAADRARIAAARTLYRQLFPAAARALLAGSQRLLLSPDGVLWDLPFAALVMNDDGPPRYLGLETPLIYTQSLTTFAKVRQLEMPVGITPDSVVVVGSPLYDTVLRASTPPARPPDTASDRASVGLRLLTHNGRVPPPLLFAAEEARQVAALDGVTASTNSEPTESWFRRRSVNASIIHLATHGYFNELRAVGSGVALAVPEREPAPGDTDNDGMLQAWEVFTQISQIADGPGRSFGVSDGCRSESAG